MPNRRVGGLSRGRVRARGNAVEHDLRMELGGGDAVVFDAARGGLREMGARRAADDGGERVPGERGGENHRGESREASRGRARVRVR